MRRLVLLPAFLIATAGAGTPQPGASPMLGEALTPAEVEAADFTVLPDGSGLPAGSGGVAAGRDVYARHCLACHGEGGEGGPNDRLVGGQGSLDSDQPVKTIGSYWPYATTVFDYLRRAMPYTSPGSLADDELYAVTAYLLFENGVVGADFVADAASLPRIRMPNRGNFDRAWPGEDAGIE